MTASRLSDRQRTFIAGRLTFGAGAMSVSCHVRDLSPHGARVTLDPQVALPQRMMLEIPSRAINEAVRMRWRHGEVAGLEFESAEAAPGEDPDQRLRALEEENAKLRKQLRELRTELANRIARDEASN